MLSGWAAPALLDGYERERRPVAAHNVERSAQPSSVPRDPALELHVDLGGRIPHVWVGRGISTLDLLGPGFTLLTGPDAGAWEALAAGLPGRVPVRVRPVHAVAARALGVTQAGALLARPTACLPGSGRTRTAPRPGCGPRSAIRPWIRPCSPRDSRAAGRGRSPEETSVTAPAARSRVPAHPLPNPAPARGGDHHRRGVVRARPPARHAPPGPAPDRRGRGHAHGARRPGDRRARVHPDARAARPSTPFVTGRKTFASRSAVADRESRDEDALPGRVGHPAARRPGMGARRRPGRPGAARRPRRADRLRRAQRCKALMDRFRAANAVPPLPPCGATGGSASITGSGSRSAASSASRTLFGVLGLVLVEREARQVRRRRHEDAEFAQALQGAADEHEAQDLLEAPRRAQHPARGDRRARHEETEATGPLARTAGAGARVEAALAVASPRDCLAVRRAPRSRTAAPRRSRSAGLRGGPGRVALRPDPGRRRGHGTVLTQTPKPLGHEQRAQLEDAVGQAAPVIAQPPQPRRRRAPRARTDGLTGLSRTPAPCRKRCPGCSPQAGRQASTLSAVMLDLDHFQGIIDAHGHQAGHDALAAVGQLLKRTVRAIGLAGRWGGEEFVLLLPDTDSAGAAILADKVRAGVAERVVPSLPSRSPRASASRRHPEHGGRRPSSPRCGHRALAAKHAGRDQVVVAPSERRRDQGIDTGTEQQRGSAMNLSACGPSLRANSHPLRDRSARTRDLSHASRRSP